MATFTQRVYGAVIVKSLDSNFNADFTHSPRTLPDGTVYATDKALKYTVRDYIRKYSPSEKLMYVQREGKDFKPLTLEQSYGLLFPEQKKESDETKHRLAVLTNLLSCIDIRLFGATFAIKGANTSIHGPVQVNHGINRFPANEIYSEQIKAPFASEAGADMTTIGSQTNLREGHYVFHITVNPKNIEEIAKAATHDGISTDDITKLKEALTRGVTALDSSRKIGSENEALLWVTLKADSTKHLPNFTELISVKIDTEKSEKRVIHCERIAEVLARVSAEIDSIELHYNPTTTSVVGLTGLTVKAFDIVSGQAM